MQPTNLLVPTTDRPRATAMPALLAALLVTGLAWGGNVDLPRFPSISPDGQKVVFSWRGDLWKVSAAKGRAVRLTGHPANTFLPNVNPMARDLPWRADQGGYRNLSITGADTEHHP